MMPPNPLQSLSDVEPGRISFSSEFLDESNFISICPNPVAEREAERARAARSANFEFLSGTVLTNMMSADELFQGGKLLPSWQTHHADKLNTMSLESDSNDTRPKKVEKIGKIEVSWFLDDDPSPRPPKCTVLWKELLKLKKQRRPNSTLASPSISSSSSSSSSRTSLADATFADERESTGSKEREKTVKRMKKLGQERTKSSSIRIRPVLNVPMCTQTKNNVLPPLFSLRKGRLDQVK